MMMKDMLLTERYLDNIISNPSRGGGILFNWGVM